MQDLRPIYYHEARERLAGNRLAVYDALLDHGAATGSELAAAMGWPVTSVRPRLTELRDCHAVHETGTRRAGEHEFRARTAAEMQAYLARLHHAFEQAQPSAAPAVQQELFA